MSIEAIYKRVYMPFKSQAQRAYMYANHPEMAKEWEAHTPDKKLPKKVKKKKGSGMMGSKVED